MILQPFRPLHPALREAATALYLAGHEADKQLTITSVRRSKRQQALLYRRYLQGLSRFPAAPPGTSKHELGLAFDLYTPNADTLRQLGALWESWGGTWGGRFKDPIHFEV